MIKIKTNNFIISYENSSSKEDLSGLLVENEKLSTECMNIAKQINTVLLLSDIKTVEGLGYKLTSKVAGSVVNAVKALWTKIINFIKKIINYITSIVQGTVIKLKVENLLKKIDSNAIFAASADFNIDWPIKTVDEINQYMITVKKYLPIIKSANNSDELKDLFNVANNLSQDSFTSTITVDEAFKRIGLKAFKGGTFGGDGINRSFSKEVHDYLMKLKDGSVDYLFQLKQAGVLSKMCLKESLELANKQSDAKKANSMQAAITIINKSSKMYIKYISSVLSILSNIYSVQCYAQPGTLAFEEWKKKQSKNRKILLIAGISVAAVASGVALAANPVAAAAVGKLATSTGVKTAAINTGKNMARTSVNTAASNVSRKLTNNMMDQVYQ